ncbi:MAG: HAD hydrolase-like protein [Bacteroidota bacterium]
MVELIIFDMAGTSINEENIVYRTITDSLKNRGYDVSLEQVLLYGAGKEKRQAITDVMANCSYTPDDKDIDLVHSEFKINLIKAYENAPLEVFPSVSDFIRRVRKNGVKIAFNTGYKRDLALSILTRVGYSIGSDIDLLVAADDVENGRPHPDMILKICGILDIAPERAVKIGDSAIDIEEGKSAKVGLTIGITTGAQTRAQLSMACPDHIIDDVKELDSILK